MNEQSFHFYKSYPVDFYLKEDNNHTNYQEGDYVQEYDSGPDFLGNLSLEDGNHTKDDRNRVNALGERREMRY